MRIFYFFSYTKPKSKVYRSLYIPIKLHTVLIIFNSIYILVILYNLNLLLSFYIEIMIQLVTHFNYKNSFIFLNKYNFLDTIFYSLYRNNILLKTLLLVR
jgi:hypothetical protein